MDTNIQIKSRHRVLEFSILTISLFAILALGITIGYFIPHKQQETVTTPITIKETVTGTPTLTNTPTISPQDLKRLVIPLCTDKTSKIICTDENLKLSFELPKTYTLITDEKTDLLFPSHIASQQIIISKEKDNKTLVTVKIIDLSGIDISSKEYQDSLRKLGNLNKTPYRSIKVNNVLYSFKNYIYGDGQNAGTNCYNYGFLNTGHIDVEKKWAVLVITYDNGSCADGVQTKFQTSAADLQEALQIVESLKSLN